MLQDKEHTSVNAFFEDDNDTENTASSLSSKTKNRNLHPKLPDENIKKDVARLMSHNSETLTFLPKIIKEKKATSKVWNNFKEALIDGKRTGIFKCNECTALYIYKTQTGTSSLTRHICAAKPKTSKSNETTDSNTRPINKVFRKTIPQQSTDDLNRDITLGLAKGLEPLNRVESEGFLYIAQALINFGAKYGAQSVKDVIKHRTTLKRTHLPEICHSLEKNVEKSLQTSPTYPHFAYTKDMWTEKYNAKSFLSLTAHRIDENWKLRHNLLGMEHFQEEKKTTANVRSECEAILAKYFHEEQVSNIVKNSTVVTDSGRNMIKAFGNRRPCECHKINTCNKWTFNEKPIPSAKEIQEKILKGKPISPKKLFNLGIQCPKIQNTITGVKELVTYFKHSKLNSQLSKSLKQEVPTRFISLYFTLKSYDDVAEEVKAILCKRNKLNMLINVDDSIVKELIQYLTPFKESSDTLSGDKYPTINRVALCYHELREHIAVKTSDSPEMQKLKEQANHCFKEFCVTDDIHYASCMLDPRYRSLKFASSTSKKRAVKLLEKWMEDELQQCNNNNVETLPQSVASNTLKSNKISKFKHLVDDNDSTPNDIPELQRYLSYRLPENLDNDDQFDVLQFWSSAKDFPTLQKVVRKILAIPASETSDERTFSDSGRAMNPRRTLLGAGTLSQLVFVSENAELNINKC